EEAGGADPEQGGVQPFGAGDLVDHDQVADRVLGGADAAGRLHPDQGAGAVPVLPDGLQHDQHGLRGGGGADLAGGGLDEVGAGADRQPGGSPHVVQGGQFAGLQDHLEVSGTAGLLDRADLLVDLEVVAGEEGAAVDDHVDLGGAVGDGAAGVGELGLQRGPAGGEGGGVRGDADAAAAQRLHRYRDQVGVDADRGGRRRGGVGGVGAAGLGGQRPDLARGVGALQRGQVDHADGQVDRGGLGGGLDRAGGQGRGALGHAHLVDARQSVQEVAEGSVGGGRLGGRGLLHGPPRRLVVGSVPGFPGFAWGHPNAPRARLRRAGDPGRR